MYLSLEKRKALDLVLILNRRKRSQQRRRVWVHQLLRSRDERGEFSLIREMRLYGNRFQAYFRLNREQFDVALTRIGPVISKMTTNRCKPIHASVRLAICLRYLATGDSYTTIASSYHVGISTVAGIVPEVAHAIWDSLVDEFMPIPKQEDWAEIAIAFQQRWNFPNCLGAIDGKHIVIQAPASSGSLYYNYKGTNSIILLVLVDAHYLFRVVDVGAYGKSCDGGTLAVSAFGRALQAGRLDLPADRALPGAEDHAAVPHVFLADEGFPLRRDLLRPFPGRHLTEEKCVYNYRLSRARLVVECAFGILAAPWRMYHRVIGVNPENAEKLVKATVVLHNFMCWNDHPEAAQGLADMPAPALQPISRVGSNNTSQGAIAVRETYCAYFSSAAGEIA